MKNSENIPARGVEDVATQIGNVVQELIYECWEEEENSRDPRAPKQGGDKKVPVVVWIGEPFAEALDDLAAEVGRTKSYVVRRIIRAYFGNHDRALKADETGKVMFEHVDPFEDVERYLFPRFRRSRKPSQKRAPSQVKQRVAG